jgi:hypothetical protein
MLYLLQSQSPFHRQKKRHGFQHPLSVEWSRRMPVRLMLPVNENDSNTKEEIVA